MVDRVISVRMNRTAAMALPSYHNYTNGRGEKFQHGLAGGCMRRLLEVDEHVHQLVIRIFLQKSADLIVVKRQADEGFLDSAGCEALVDFLVEDRAGSYAPCRADAALAFNGEPGEHELAHAVLWAFVDRDVVGNSLCEFVELRNGRQSHVQIAAAGILVPDGVPQRLDFHAVCGISGLQRDDRVEHGGGFGDVAAPDYAAPSVLRTGIDRCRDCDARVAARPRDVRGRTADFHAEVRVCQIDRPDLLEFEEFNKRARVRLANDIREALLKSAIV